MNSVRFRLIAVVTAAAVATTALIVLLPRRSVAAEPIDIRQVSTSTAGPVISGDGRFVAAQLETTLNGANDRIVMHDQLTDKDEVVSDFQANSQPVMSSDGRLVGFAGVNKTSQIFVADRSKPGPPHQVTGTPSDLEFQRMLQCRGEGITFECGPGAMARDGKTIVFPARLDPHSPALRIAVDGSSVDRDHPFVDFDTRGTPGDTSQAHLTVTANRDVTFSGPPTIGGPQATAFSSTSTCTGKLAAGATCTVDVTLTFPAPTCTTFFATLQTQGATPDARTLVPMIAEVACPAPQPPRRESAAAACSDLVPGQRAGFGSSSVTNAGNLGAPGMSVPVGRSGFTSIVVTNTDTETSVGLALNSPDCTFDLVTPDQPDAGPPPCNPTGLLNPGAQCTAYVAFRGPNVGAFMADMQLFRENGTALGQSYRFEALAIQDVWLARTDSTGTGDFANPSNPGPGIVNLDIDGSIIEAVSPSVSGDGRYVAFQTREDNDGRDRVLRLDRSTGAVEEVGLLDNGKPPNGDAVAPSLSRSGQRVAFVTPNSADNSQVRVRDLDLGRTVLASARANDPQQEARARSSQPALSGDGTTVAFTSRGSDLTADETTGEQMYVRNVEADFTGVGERGNELVSVRQDGSTAPDVQSFSPTVDEFGAYVAFQSTGALVADGTLGSYVVRRAGNAGVDPASLEFGRLPLGVTGGPLAVAVSNTGRGAIQVAPAAAPAPYKVESSDCDLLRRGESCTVTVSFRPTKGGAAPGTLSIATRQGFAVQEPVAVALSGSGLDPTEPPGPGQPPAPGVAALSVSPPRIAFAEQALASISPVQQAVVRNVGSVPLRISASGTSAEFPVSSRCGLLPAGASCSVDVRFKPNVVGERSGAVQIRGQATQAGVRDPAAATVTVTGATAVPVLTVEPFMIRPGRTAAATGTGFAPNTEVKLVWSQGNGTSTVRTDAAGNFTVPVLVVRRDVLGSRELIASPAGASEVRSTPVLVIPRTGQPPAFLSRG